MLIKTFNILLFHNNYRIHYTYELTVKIFYVAWCDKNFACSIKTSEKNFCAVSEKSVNQISQLDMVYLTSTYSCFAISVKWKVTFRRYAEIIYISACWGVEFYGFWAKRVADSAKDRYFLRLDNKQKRSETCSC